MLWTNYYKKVEILQSTPKPILLFIIFISILASEQHLNKFTLF